MLYKNNIWNYIFVAFFMISLWIPMSCINRKEYSDTENRALAVMPHLMVQGKINTKFGEEFNAWFNDRFFGRNILIRLYNTALSKVQINENATTGNARVLIGQDNWLFFKGDNSIKNYTNSNTPDEAHMKRGLQYLNDINNWCKKHNKQFYYIIAPDKNKIYSEFYPKDIKKAKSDQFGIGMTFYNYIRKNSDINVIYPYDELMAAKGDDLLYYTNDTHWNMRGSYVLFKMLYRKIFHKNFDEGQYIRHWTEVQHKGDLVKMLDLQDSSKYMQVKSKKPEFIHDIKCEHTKKYSSNNGLIQCRNQNGMGRAYVFRDSFTTALSPYLAQVFNVVDFHWKYNIEKPDLDAIVQDYDIVILENVERYTSKILEKQFPKD